MNQHYTQSKNILFNPQNTVNPDSKSIVDKYNFEQIYHQSFEGCKKRS
jgi:hypothetical protein